MTTIKYFSMYSGVGGFEYGIQEAISILRDRGTRPKHGRGSESVLSQQESQPTTEIPSVTCIGYSEIDKYAEAVYKYNYGTDIKNYGNADEINAEELPDFDLLVGGFPCQAFSIAGKRRGFDDTRGTQFFNIARIVREKQPRLLVLENVKGLLSHDDGRTYHIIASTLDELGYDVEAQVLNSKNHGVPQNRERVFIIGRIRGRGGRQIFPFTGENGRDTRKVGQELSVCLDANYAKGATVNTLRKQQRQHVQIRAVLTPDRPTKRQNGRRVKEPGEEMFTLTGQDHHGVCINTDKLRIRRLTPKECEQLQGFPNDWTKYGVIEGKVVEMSDTQRYKMMGNAVTTNVIRDIMIELFSDEPAVEWYPSQKQHGLDGWFG